MTTRVWGVEVVAKSSNCFTETPNATASQITSTINLALTERAASSTIDAWAEEYVRGVVWGEGGAYRTYRVVVVEIEIKGADLFVQFSIVSVHHLHT